jgi:hypothetical protein
MGESPNETYADYPRRCFCCLRADARFGTLNLRALDRFMLDERDVLQHGMLLRRCLLDAGLRIVQEQVAL